MFLTRAPEVELFAQRTKISAQSNFLKPFSGRGSFFLFRTAAIKSSTLSPALFTGFCRQVVIVPTLFSVWTQMTAPRQIIRTQMRLRSFSIHTAGRTLLLTVNKEATFPYKAVKWHKRRLWANRMEQSYFCYTWKYSFKKIKHSF